MKTLASVEIKEPIPAGATIIVVEHEGIVDVGIEITTFKSLAMVELDTRPTMQPQPVLVAASDTKIDHAPKRVHRDFEDRTDLVALHLQKAGKNGLSAGQIATLIGGVHATLQQQNLAAKSAATLRNRGVAKMEHRRWFWIGV